jgi:hypothetical protein
MVSGHETRDLQRPMASMLAGDAPGGTTCHWPPPPAPMLSLILASPDAKRLEIVANNLRLMPNSSEHSCVIVFYARLKEEESHLLRPLMARCPSVCLLTKSSYTASIKRAAPPDYVAASFPKGVFLLLDDVALHFPVGHLIRAARSHRLDVASATIHNTYPYMAPAAYASRTSRAVPRRVSMVETQAQWMSVSAWRCFWELLDPATNGGGYGIDWWFQDWFRHRRRRMPQIALFDAFVGDHCGGAARVSGIVLPHPEGSLWHDAKTSHAARIKEFEAQNVAWDRAGHHLRMAQLPPTPKGMAIEKKGAKRDSGPCSGYVQDDIATLGP